MDKQVTDMVQNDMVVMMDYALTVDGSVIDDNIMPYLHGYNNIIPGLENALTGMKVGESKEVYVKAANAYGEYDHEAVVNVNRSSFPKDFEIKLGHPLRVRDESGHIFSGTITALSEETIEMDLNHPLAGKDLNFKVTITNMREATPEELARGQLQSECGGCGSHGCGDDCGDGCCG